MALNLERSCFSLLVPHSAGEVLLGVDDLVLSSVYVESWLLHLDTKFSHHNCRLGLVLVGLHLSLKFVWMVVGSLVCLRESMVVSDTVSVVAETTEVRLWALLLFDSHSHNFDLNREFN